MLLRRLKFLGDGEEDGAEAVNAVGGAAMVGALGRGSCSWIGVRV